MAKREWNRGAKMNPGKILGDYDIWYKKCENCGYDTAKSTLPKEGNKTCWQCGRTVRRDYSERALKNKES